MKSRHLFPFMPSSTPLSSLPPAVASREIFDLNTTPATNSALVHEFNQRTWLLSSNPIKETVVCDVTEPVNAVFAGARHFANRNRNKYKMRCAEIFPAWFLMFELETLKNAGQAVAKQAAPQVATSSGNSAEASV